jgi:hypothetical protein
MQAGTGHERWCAEGGLAPSPVRLLLQHSDIGMPRYPPDQFLREGLELAASLRGGLRRFGCPERLSAHKSLRGIEGIAQQPHDHLVGNQAVVLSQAGQDLLLREG